MNSKLKKVAVILSGCGRADGSEIQEAVSILINLSKNKL
jgi:enhancing lycopene biosynthesis protein 2